MTSQNPMDCITQILNLVDQDSDTPLTIIPVEKLVGAHHTRHDPAHGLLVTGITSAEDLTGLCPVLITVYPEVQPVKLIVWNSETKNVSKSEQLVLHDLNDGNGWETGTEGYLYVSPLEKEFSFEEFQEIIAHLRAPNGCPWDREQTHLSLRNNLLEETYETLEAIDRQDIAGMQEEFGDLLLQIVLHAQIAAEAGEYRMEDVIAGIYSKIVRRHPHVFGEAEVSGVQGVLQNWEKLKQQERADKGVPEKGLLDGVPVVLPSLTQAQELQDRAARVGFDWPTIEPVWDKVLEELEEVRQAGSPEEVEKELGDLLFAVVNLIRWYKVDSESALRGTNQKFRRRFKHIEKSARSLGRDLQSMTLDEMDEYWNEAKGFE
jgi:tetrapyrrole methylase family protein / MazG family protein